MECYLKSHRQGKNKTQTPDKFVINNKILRDTNVISDSFNIFHVSIGPDLAKKYLNVIEIYKAISQIT